jgi:hypothetical protein
MCSLPHLLRRSPFVKLGQQRGFDPFQLLSEQSRVFLESLADPVLSSSLSMRPL